MQTNEHWKMKIWDVEYKWIWNELLTYDNLITLDLIGSYAMNFRVIETKFVYCIHENLCQRVLMETQYIQRAIYDMSLKWSLNWTSSLYSHSLFSLYRYTCNVFFIVFILIQFNIMLTFFRQFRIFNLKRLALKQCLFQKILRGCFNKYNIPSKMYLFKPSKLPKKISLFKRSLYISNSKQKIWKMFIFDWFWLSYKKGRYRRYIL